jgi:NTP pyrophosphatase (non-canonical NTP hydrolase)
MTMFETAMFLDTMEQVQKSCHKNSKDHGFWDHAEYVLEEPHYVDSESCMGDKEQYWRCWAKLSSGKFVGGCGLTPDQAKREAEEKAKVAGNSFAEKIALIHSEISEALEKHRKTMGKGLPDSPDEHCPEHTGIAIEFADAVIRIMDLAEYLSIDLGRAILAKMAFNKTRSVKHGKAY